MSEKVIIDYLEQFKDDTKAKHSARFFKTDVGEYGEGDRFLGINVPTIRQAISHFKAELSLNLALNLLKKPYHEVRLFAVLAVVALYQRGSKDEKENVYQAYLEHSQLVNNWDLVDSSAHKIVGVHLLNQDKTILLTYAQSENLWQRRIAMMSTYTFIKAQDFQTTIELAKLLLNDNHDLIHKVVGWMLREMGKQNIEALRSFLNDHAKLMPRTMLRYAIEKLSQAERQHYLSIKAI